LRKSNKETKALALYHQPHRGLTSPKDRRVLIIGLSLDEIDKREYLLDEIKTLKANNQKLKDAINSLSGRKDELKYLKEFRDIFLMHCIKSNVRKTILQFTSTILLEGCAMKYTCKPRIEILKRIEI